MTVSTGPAIGIDIGGSKILAATIDADGRVTDTESAQTPGRSVEVAAVEEALVHVVQALHARHGPSTVGIGAAGFVDETHTRVRFAPHLPWRDEPLAQRLGQRLQDTLVGRVVLDNDANAALWAEAQFGAVQDVPDAVMVTLGTGIGGAMMLDRRIFRGLNGMAGEFGHTQVVPEGRECECGNSGCWEQYASGRALAREMKQRGRDLVGPEITKAARSGDADALACFEVVGRAFGIGLANLVASFDPAAVVVGGGVAAAGGLLLRPAREAMAERLVGRGHRREPRLVLAQLGPMAGAIGAADMARAQLREE